MKNRHPWLPIRHSVESGWTPDTPPDLSEARDVYLDAETTGLRWFDSDRPIGWAVRALGKSYYLPFGHRGGGNLSEETVKEWMRRELRGKRIINHSTKFDALMTRAWGVDLEAQGCTFRDVAHSAALLDDHRKEFDLSALGEAYLGIGKLDPGPKDNLAALPAWDLAAYAKRDVDLVEGLHRTFDPLLRADDLLEVQTLEDQVLPAVVEMQWNGLPFNEELCAEWEALSARLLDKMRWAVYRSLGFNPNPDSPKDMTRVFHQLKIPVSFTDKGAPSFTKDIVKAGVQQDPTGALAMIYEIGKLTDLRSKYLSKYLRDHHKGIIYPNLWQLMTDEGGTVSGRFSCSGPNMQQVMGRDKHLREYGFIARRLNEFLGMDLPLDQPVWLIKKLFRPGSGQWQSVDAKQQEYRIFGHFSESEHIIGKYRDDPETDFHNIVKAMIVAARPDINRTEVKTANFLKIFGGQVGALSRNLNIDIVTAQEIDDAYNASFPEAKALVDRAKAVAEDRGWVRTIKGRRCRFPWVTVEGRNGNRWRKRERTHKALNAVVQGSGADITKTVMVEVHRNRKFLEVLPRLTVHDSHESDRQNPDKAAAIAECFNTQYVPLSIPILWDINTGATWGDCK